MNSFSGVIALQTQLEKEIWLGLRHSEGSYGLGEYCLTYDNDIRCMSFEKIADTIEQKQDKLFE